VSRPDPMTVPLVAAPSETRLAELDYYSEERA
jgi:hypothetical protein